MSAPIQVEPQFIVKWYSWADLTLGRFQDDLNRLDKLDYRIERILGYDDTGVTNPVVVYRKYQKTRTQATII